MASLFTREQYDQLLQHTQAVKKKAAGGCCVLCARARARPYPKPSLAAAEAAAAAALGDEHALPPSSSDAAPADAAEAAPHPFDAVFDERCVRACFHFLSFHVLSFHFLSFHCLSFCFLKRALCAHGPLCLDRPPVCICLDPTLRLQLRRLSVAS